MDMDNTEGMEYGSGVRAGWGTGEGQGVLQLIA